MPGRMQHQRSRQGTRKRRRFSSVFAPPVTAQAGQINVGEKLRALREERQLTLRALADVSGLNVNTLSLIENGKSSPSVNTLQQIAQALDVPMVAFFEDDQPGAPVVYRKADTRPRAKFSHGTLEDLGTSSQDCPFEAMIVEISPQAGSGATPIVHTGYELVYCLQGEIHYKVADHIYSLQPGDSLVFEAHLPHSWNNADHTPARMILLLSPVDERDHPTERHFSAQGLLTLKTSER
jgi:transcriptional regulator with XRE-family HTH domain